MSAPEIPGLPEIPTMPKHPVFEAVTEAVPDPHSQYLLLHALTHSALVLKLKLRPDRYPWSFLPRLGVPRWKYAKAVDHLKATGLVEFKGDGRVTTGMRLSAAGEAWARSKGLLRDLRAPHKRDKRDRSDRT